jgi:hypothetical protein
MQQSIFVLFLLNYICFAWTKSVLNEKALFDPSNIFVQSEKITFNSDDSNGPTIQRSNELPSNANNKGQFWIQIPFSPTSAQNQTSQNVNSSAMNAAQSSSGLQITSASKAQNEKATSSPHTIVPIYLETGNVKQMIGFNVFNNGALQSTVIDPIYGQIFTDNPMKQFL